MSMTKETSTQRGFSTHRRWAMTGAAAMLALLMWPVATWAFEQAYHERLTESLLRGIGFDVDSADEVGDSNYYTDVFEPNNESAHADNNQLGAASMRLRTKRAEIGDALNSCQRRDAL